jgi:dTDP-4-amino-4,6-dideoxygalactose transaminase
MSGKKIRLSKSSIGAQEKEAVLKVLDNEFLGMGEEVKLFEDEIKSYIETNKEVVSVNTGTSALHLALVGLDIGEGDEVLVPSLTYVASYQAISATGATPISVDVREDTLFIDIKDAKKRVSTNTKAIMPVHYASDSSRMREIYDFALEYNLRVVEDAAHSFGCQRDSKLIGYEGDIVCFSFDGIKNITSGEGGAILSSDIELIQRVKDARLLGVEKDSEKRYKKERSWDFDVKYQGFRYHMSNIFAAIGREQLKKIDQIKIKRQRVINYYLQNLNIKEITFLPLDYPNIITHIFVIKVEKRDKLREYLISHNIECGIHYKPNHLLSKYKSSYSLPITEKIYEEILTLPCHTDLKEDEQEFIIKKIEEFYSE